jgi:glycosyltransferase involved in cell wall biosynthesis
MAPFVVTQRYAPHQLRQRLAKLTVSALDRLVASTLQPCDVLIAMSGMFVETLKTARRKYGAKIILERGSRHIRSQDEILRKASAVGVDPFYISRELAGYGIADFITVPSQHVSESFLEFGVPPEKLFSNPYGCDLEMFPTTVRIGGPDRTILFVGTWSVQKGCDVLVQALRLLEGVRLVHVGSGGDIPYPGNPNFLHVDPVPQEELTRHYAQCDVFVHASRQEGLSLVLCQALASGLPVVCTTRTGGRDIASLIGRSAVVFEIPPDDPVALAAAIRRALDLPRGPQGAPRDILQSSRAALSWREYGRRYDQFLSGLA